MSDSDSDYNVEEYIKPEVIRHTYNNDDPISDLENSDNQESLSENEDGISDKLKCSKTNNDEEKDVGENIEEPVRTNSRNILHVSNLEFGTTKEDLYEVFKEAGDMKGIRVPKGRKGFAFVEMKNEEGLKRALSLSGQEINGNRILVNEGSKSKKHGPSKKKFNQKSLKKPIIKKLSNKKLFNKK